MSRRTISSEGVVDFNAVLRRSGVFDCATVVDVVIRMKMTQTSA
jgi:hypothetical protein